MPTLSISLLQKSSSGRTKDWVRLWAKVSCAWAISSSVLPNRDSSGCKSTHPNACVSGLACEEAADYADGMAVPLSVSKVALRLDAAVWLARAMAREACPMDIVALHKSFIPCTTEDAQALRLDVSIASRRSGESANSP